VPSPNGGTNGQPSNTGDTGNSNSIDENRNNVNNNSNGNSDNVSLNEGLLLGFLIVCIFLLSMAVVFTYKRRRILQIKRNQKQMKDLENMQVPLNYTPSSYNENDGHAGAVSSVRKDDLERFNPNLKVHSSSTSFQPYDESRNKAAANRDKGNRVNYYLRRGSSGHASENISVTPELVSRYEIFIYVNFFPRLNTLSYSIRSIFLSMHLNIVQTVYVRSTFKQKKQRNEMTMILLR